MTRLLLFLLLLTGAEVYASDSTWDDVVRTFKRKEISTDDIAPSISKKILRNIELLDLRSDTNRIGMFTDFRYRPNELVFANSQKLENILKTKLTDEKGNQSILLIVQDFWLNEIHAQIIESKEGYSKPEIHTSKIVCKVDVFVKENTEYIPLTRIDTVIWDKRSIVFSSTQLISNVLGCINNKITTSINTNAFKSKKSYSREQITSSYSQRYSYPIFVGATPKKGLYTSLEEFKNNKPSFENFAIKGHKKEAPSLFIVDEKGNETMTKNVWGVCDGTNMYIMQKGLLFKLYRNANAFYWMGVKYFDQRMFETPQASPLGVGAEVGMEDPVATSVKIRLTPYLLHPETGEGY